MKAMISLTLFLLSMTIPVHAAGTNGPKEQAEQIKTVYGRLPLSFEANFGQTDPNVKFLSRGNGFSLFLTRTEAVLTLRKRSDAREMGPAVLRMQLLNANPSPEIAGVQELPGRVNYFIGNNPKKWRSNIPTYARVKYQNVYPGVDLVYYGNQGALEYDFVVSPGADPEKIALGFQGADRLEIDPTGDLILKIDAGEVRLQKPVIYQESHGVKQAVLGHYVLKDKIVGFQIAAYDRSEPLIIDPVLAYATYLGGSDFDEGHGIAADASGNAYVTGRTPSIDFPTTGGAFQPACRLSLGNCTEIFVTKLNPTGDALIYSTYLGGGGEDKGHGIAVDSSGNAYVTGETISEDFPITPGAFQPTKAAGDDAFVTKLNPTGSALVYSTYLGGGGDGDGKNFGHDFGNDIAVDASGNAYVTGVTNSFGFPTTPGAFQTTSAGGDAFGAGDAFVSKVNATGTGLIYSTYLGGTGNADEGKGISVDARGNAYVAGSTNSTNFPTANAFQPIYGGGSSDAFVTKLNTTGSALVYSTFLGGSGRDIGAGIAIDSSGNAYATGETRSFNFPIANPFQPSFSGGTCGGKNTFTCFDTFVTKLNTEGNALVYSTYLGGAGDERAGGIAIDASGSAYVTGLTASDDFPTAHPIQPTRGEGGHCLGEDSFAPCSDGFVAKLNPAGTALAYSTYLGGSQEEDGNGISVDGFGNAYVTGFTRSTNFPTVRPFQSALAGGSDAFIAKIAVTSSSGDSFDRTNSTHLGPDWNEYQPDLEIFNHQVRNVDAGSKAALFHRAIGPDQDVAVDCMMTATRNNCAVMARWSNANHFYRARLDVGAQDFKIFKTVNGSTTFLGGVRCGPGVPGCSQTLAFNTFYRIRLVVQGTSLQAFFGNETTPAISVTDTSLTLGDFAGIRSFSSAAHTTWFDNFAISSVGAEPLNQPPTARMTSNPTSGTAPLTVHFDGTGSSDPDGTIISYFWDFGDGRTGSGSTVDHTYTSPGTFTAILTVRDNGGAQDTDQTTITVTPAGGGVVFSDNFNRPNSTNLGADWNEYQPDLEIFNGQIRNRNTGSQAAQFVRSIRPDQDVSVECMMTAARNNCAVMARWSNANNFYRARLDVGAQDFKIFKTVNGTTTLLGTARRTLQFNTFYRIRLLVRGTSLQAFFANETTPAISVTDPSLTAGNFSGIRSFTSAANTIFFDNFRVTSSGAPANQSPTARMTANPTSGTAPLTVHFDGSASSDPDGTIASYAWNFGDGTTGTGPIIDHTYTSAGTFTATLTVTDNQGAQGSAQATITVTSGAAVLFNDEFNRTTGLGTNWRVYAGSWSTDGSHAVSTSTINYAGITQSLGTDDYTVEARLMLPAGVNHTGVIARGNPAALNQDLYAALLYTNGSVQLYRRKGFTWVQLKSAPAAINANTFHTLGLKVSGTNPVNLEVFLNGVSLMTFSDGSPSRILSGIPGMLASAALVKYDRFTALR